MKFRGFHENWNKNRAALELRVKPPSQGPSHPPPARSFCLKRADGERDLVLGQRLRSSQS
jgi:hypothetical protein